MEIIVKKYTFKKLKELTQNLNFFYYKGAINSLAETLETFCIGFIFKDLSILKESLNKLNIFLNDYCIKNNEFNENLWFNTGHYNRNTIFILQLNIHGSKDWGVLKDEHFFMAEQFEKELEKYIQENKLIPEIITKDPKKFEQVSIDQMWDPRNPDPNYMFLLKDEEI